MKFLSVFAILFLVIGANSSLGETDKNAESLFQEGIALYSQKKYQESSEKFRQALEDRPDSTSLLFNWGLSLYRQNQLGPSVAAWRKALYLEPALNAANVALAEAEKKLPAQSFEGLAADWNYYRNHILNEFTFIQVLCLSLLFLFVSGFTTIKYLAQRKRSKEEQLPLPPIPSLAAVCTILFVLSITLFISKFVDITSPRATIISPKATLYVGPSKSDSTIVELIEGYEVYINKTSSEWTQVTLPGGFSGWVESKLLFRTSGSKLW